MPFDYALIIGHMFSSSAERKKRAEEAQQSVPANGKPAESNEVLFYASVLQCALNSCMHVLLFLQVEQISLGSYAVLRVSKHDKF